jgi:2-dehydropantoate 2-reductase
MTDRKILLVGCGAIGGIFAAALAPACDLVAYDSNEEHMRAIRTDGLKVIGARERTVRFRAVSRAGDLAGSAFDAVLFLVKSSATAGVVEQLRPAALAGSPLLVTLQNGMGHSDALLAVPDVPVARGVTMHAGRYVGSGCVEHLIEGETWLGPLRGQVDDIRWFGRLLDGANLPARVIADPMPAVWSKFVFNSVMNPVGALLLGNNAARYDSPHVRALIDDMAAECIRIVTALGGTFAFDPMDFVNKVRSGELPVSSHAGSMALDIARGAPTEIDELTGYVVTQAERLGIPVPTCRAVYRLVKGLELAAVNLRGNTAPGEGLRPGMLPQGAEPAETSG